MWTYLLLWIDQSSVMEFFILDPKHWRLRVQSIFELQQSTLTWISFSWVGYCIAPARPNSTSFLFWKSCSVGLCYWPFTSQLKAVPKHWNLTWNNGGIHLFDTRWQVKTRIPFLACWNFLLILRTRYYFKMNLNDTPFYLLVRLSQQGK